MKRAAVAAALLVACGNDRASVPANEPPKGSAFGRDASVADAAAPAAIALPPAPPLPDVPRGLPAAPALDGVTPEAVALGELLFWDPRLSSTGKISCATCHEPHRNYAGDARLPNAEGVPNLRRASALVNLAWRAAFGWDGRYTSFPEHLAAHVHGQYRHALDAAIAKLADVPGYRAHFARLGGAPSADLATTALHAFVMTRYEGDAPWDREERASGPRTGSQGALRRGYTVFTTKAQCSVCHTPPLYTDGGYHRLGLITVKDEGRGRIDAQGAALGHVPDPAKRGAFATPTLRGAALRASLFHDGSAADLAAAIDYHLAGGIGQGADPSIVDVEKVELTADERADLVAFVRALSRAAAPLTPPVLP